MWFPDISKFPWKNIDFMIIGFLDMVIGITSIISFGFIHPEWTFTYLFWRFAKMSERNIKLRKQE